MLIYEALDYNFLASNNQFTWGGGGGGGGGGQDLQEYFLCPAIHT